MVKQLICQSCETESVIIENELFFSEEKKIDNAYCPSCQSIIYESLTDGWFFVQTLQKYNFDKETQKLECTYPMP
jgi:hypothetical protein